MACVDTLNISSELNLTPSRKRKRQFEKLQQQLQEQNALKTAAVATSCFTNAAFSSTPKKILGKRRIQLSSSKENARAFVPNIGLEVKSIADIVENNNEDFNKSPKNPYEVMRKPPKKKKRPTEDVACFENPALNLELPEKQFNPYEVVRDVVKSNNSNCFSNPALNLKIQDAPAARNPFEIQRETPIKSVNLKNLTEPAVRNPFENTPELVKESSIVSPKPCNLRIGLPFIPTVGCRLNFKDMSMSQLTPSKLLAEKLVFSPVPKAKTSLGSIGEETTMDIGKELDLYQLELENSINEAKLRKGGIFDNFNHSPEDPNLRVQVIDIERKFKITQKLTGISEDGENEEIIEEATEQTEHHLEIHIQPNHTDEVPTKCIENNNPFVYELIEGEENEQKICSNTNSKNPFECEFNHDNDKADRDDLEDLYGCSDYDRDEEDSFDFQTPAPFVRAYTKAAEPKLTVSKESLKAEDAIKSSETNEEHFKKPMNVKNMIRNSIRKLMHPHQHNQEHQMHHYDQEEDIQIKPEHEKHSLIKSIRHSLRRKPARNLLEEEAETKVCELSIIDSSERTMKLKSDFIQNEDLTNEKKHTLRNSIRKSSRDVRNQFMKSVFHKKHEEYDFNK